MSGWGLGDWWFFALWAALLVVGLAAIVGTSRDLVILSAGAAVLALPQVAGIAIYRANRPSLSAADPASRRPRLWRPRC